MSLLTQYTLWLLPLCLLVGAGCAALLYYKSTNPELEKRSRIILSSLRGLSVALLCFLLLAPMLKMIVKELDKPQIIIALDNSESIILASDSAYYHHQYINKVQDLAASFDKHYDVRLYTVGSQNTVHQDFDSEMFSFNEKSTDLSSFFSEIGTLYGNRNIGAVILMSDGIINKGSNPYYQSSSMNYPVYTVGLGNAETHTDLLISNVNHNKQALKGNYFPVEIKISATQLSGNDVQCVLSEGDNILMTKNLRINSRNYFETVRANIEANSKGLHKYKVELNELEGEITYKNNVAYFYVEVIDSREKIAIVYNSPHPDISALKSALESSETYDVQVSSIQDFKSPVEDFSLIILHQLPSTSQAASNLLSQIQKSRTSALYVIGSQTDLQSFNHLNTGLNLQQNKNLFNQSMPLYNENFTSFTFSEESRQLLKSLPPMTTLFGDYKTSISSNVFLYQKINSVNTEYPLVMFNDNNGAKTGIICGTGIWQWKLYNYLYMQSHLQFNEIIMKMAAYLSVKADKSLFRVAAKNVYEEYQPVVITAELYNESYELVNDADVTMTITDKDGKKHEQQLSKQNNQYVLDMGQLPVGDYQWVCATRYGKNSYSKSGAFTVDEVLLEATQTTADFNLLQSLSQATGGKFYLPDQMDKIAQEIQSDDNIKPIANYTKKYSLLLNTWWYFTLIILLLGIEWFIRKWNGGI